MVKVGDKAPDFCLLNQNSEMICLEDFKGQWVVIYFYPRANTPGCTIEAKGFTANLEEFEKKNAVILGISSDPVPKLKKFEEKHGLKIILLSDEEHTVISLYDAWVKKKIGPKEFFGTQRSTFLINPEGVIEQIWSKVKVKRHVEEVKLALLNKT
ncbi:MAG: thioredoxin-dependent thiol peroxidase [Candidatus Heimdallarchaeaceae archaeon]